METDAVSCWLRGGTTPGDRHWIMQEVKAGKVDAKMIVTAVYWFTRYAMARWRETKRRPLSTFAFTFAFYLRLLPFTFTHTRTRVHTDCHRIASTRLDSPVFRASHHITIRRPTAS